MIGGALRVVIVRQTGALRFSHTLKFFGITTTGRINTANSFVASRYLARLTQASSVRAIVAARDWRLWGAFDRIANVRVIWSRDDDRRVWAARARIFALNIVPYEAPCALVEVCRLAFIVSVALGNLAHSQSYSRISCVAYGALGKVVGHAITIDAITTTLARLKLVEAGELSGSQLWICLTGIAIVCAWAAFVEEILLARESWGPASGVIGDTDARMVGVNTVIDNGIVAATRVFAGAAFIAGNCVEKV